MNNSPVMTPLSTLSESMATPFLSLDVLMASSRSDAFLVAYHAQSFHEQSDHAAHAKTIVTWATWHTDVQRLTVALQSHPAQKWALCFDDSYQFAVAFMAATHAGKHLILPGNHQPDALLALAEHFDAILHDRAHYDGLTCPQWRVSAEREPAYLAESSISANTYAFTTLALADCRLTLFTSGSSGVPKAIEKTLADLAEEVQHHERTWGTVIAGSRIASTVSHQHIYGLLFRILWPLCAGRAFARHDLVYPEQVIAHADSDTTLVTSPALLKRLTDASSANPYRAVYSSGGPLSHEAAQNSHTLFTQWPIEVFGSTETGGIAFRQQHDPQTPWQVFDVIDVVLNAEGCLRIRSPFVDAAQWYQTSDQCQLLDHRQFLLLGRVDRIVKIEEKRISLTEVEARLCALPWVKEVAVLVLEDPRRVSLGAVLTLTADGEAELETLGKGAFWLALRQALRRWLEPVGIPRRYRVVDDIPLNSQGKRLVRDLETLF
ncbi:AMP-binding protein [Photobacterium japonica]|uniref:AMP-binding protein n=1 Tax=Photobacterium japonica TaxID=2910235 RepID=UPI003D0AAB29